jgi:ubiquinone/menaquinone biosynthesis C-methylase UbiE
MGRKDSIAGSDGKPLEPIGNEPQQVRTMGPTMSESEIRKHWQTWAQEYGTGLRATTKRPSAKDLEIDALARNLRMVAAPGRSLDVLEVGCGNGHNILALAELFPQARFTGVDYVPEMIAAAETSLKTLPPNTADRIRLDVGDVLELSAIEGLFQQYDVVFTDRCLINLNTAQKQTLAIDELARKLKSTGSLILIENSLQTYEAQNDCREILGLHRRVPERFNLFLDETVILPHLQRLFHDVDIEDFISFHDLVLYVLTPLLCNGKVDHSHPLVEAAKKLNIAISQSRPSAFGCFGQNRLYHCRRQVGPT